MKIKVPISEAKRYPHSGIPRLCPVCKTPCEARMGEWRHRPHARRPHMEEKQEFFHKKVGKHRRPRCVIEFWT